MPRPATKEPKAPSLGDNLRVSFRGGIKAVFLNTRQTAACREVQHLLEAITTFGPTDESLSKGASDAWGGLRSVIAVAGKCEADGQLPLPFMQETGETPPADMPPPDATEAQAESTPPETQPDAPTNGHGRKKRGATA